MNLGKRGLCLTGPPSLCFVQPLHSQTQRPVTRTNLCPYFKHRLSLLLFITAGDDSLGSNFKGSLPAHMALVRLIWLFFFFF